MLKVKNKKYQLHVRGNIPDKRFKIVTRITALLSGHPVQKSTAIHLHPCNPAPLPKNTCSIVFCGTFLSNLFMYLVAFGNIMWKLDN